MASSPVSGLDGSAPFSPATPSVEAAVQAAEVITSPRRVREVVVLDSGITLTLKKVPPLAIREASVRIPRPPVPVVYMADRDREIENPNDPEYALALQRWEADTINAATNVMLLLGVEITHVPEDIPGVDDEGWLAELRYLGIEVEDSPFARKLAWLRMVALEDNEAISAVLGAISRRAGLTEGEVALAAANFRSEPERGADPPVPVEAPGDDGDRV